MVDINIDTLAEKLYKIPGVKEAVSEYTISPNPTKEEVIDQIKYEIVHPHMISYKTFKEQIAPDEEIKEMISGLQKREKMSLEDATYYCYNAMYDKLSVRIIQHLVKKDPTIA